MNMLQFGLNSMVIQLTPAQKRISQFCEIKKINYTFLIYKRKGQISPMLQHPKLLINIVR
jgi:hypothetical protein